MRARTQRGPGGGWKPTGPSWNRRAARLALAGLALGFSAGISPAAAQADTGPLIDVIVRGAAGTAGAAEAANAADAAAAARSAENAVRRVGGTVGQRLDLIGGFSAKVPEAALAAIRRASGVDAVTVNSPVRLNADGWESDEGESDDEESNAWEADDDASSLYSLTKAAGVHSVWSKSASGGKKVTGAGIGVALIDSGVAPVKGLAGTGKVVNGPDLSFESQADNLRYLDTYGHGTHLAGIIAGKDPNVAAGNENDDDHFVGVAPDAHIVNVKVAAADGATDVSQVIAAIDWVVQHRNDPGMNIRVLNLSFGTDSVQDSRFDPLSHAVEVAWRHGIVVVVAVGNDGAGQTRVSMPAANKYVLAVGATDPKGTDGRKDDVVADFSTRGNSARHADILAAGRSIVSLRNPGSFADAHNPGALVDGDSAQRFFRGSGTSQSAAFVSGAAALLLQQRPSLTPDQVKRLLTNTTQYMPSSTGDVYGAGQIDVKKASETSAPTYKQTHSASLGTGTLEGARGSAHVADSESGVELTGEQDIFGQAWNATLWATQATAGTTWSRGTWNGNAWTGDDWTGTSWTARTWSARTWSARTWSGSTWTARTWSDAVWTGSIWSARTWSARTWSARTWSGNYWSARTWV